MTKNEILASEVLADKTKAAHTKRLLAVCMGGGGEFICP